MLRTRPVPAKHAKVVRQRHTSRRTVCTPRADLDAAAQVAVTVADTAKYVPSAMEVEPWQIYVGTVAGFAPFVIAAYEFGKRILIQRQCEMCKGSGLVQRGKYLRKCTACGGFLPWQSWQRFFESSPGNGSVVRYPKGQTSVFFSVEKATAASQEMAAARDQRESAGSVDGGGAAEGAAASTVPEQQEASGSAGPKL